VGVTLLLLFFLAFDGFLRFKTVFCAFIQFFLFLQLASTDFHIFVPWVKLPIIKKQKYPRICRNWVKVKTCMAGGLFPEYITSPLAA